MSADTNRERQFTDLQKGNLVKEAADLGVAPGASSEEIAKARKAAARTLHPDRSSAPDAAAKMQSAMEVLDTIADPARFSAWQEANGAYRAAEEARLAKEQRAKTREAATAQKQQASTPSQPSASSSKGADSDTARRAAYMADAARSATTRRSSFTPPVQSGKQSTFAVDFVSALNVQKRLSPQMDNVIDVLALAVEAQHPNLVANYGNGVLDNTYIPQDRAVQELTQDASFKEIAKSLAKVGVIDKRQLARVILSRAAENMGAREGLDASGMTTLADSSSRASSRLADSSYRSAVRQPVIGRNLV